ncbi:MAG: hypothetical protein M3Y85_12970 [Bacteroidota bacterium]|nr:hypothetical protein [Bacteroidota bacterium]
MGNRIQALAQQVCGKVTVEECSVDELRQLTNRFPYYAPAQFLLLQKLKEEGSPEFDLQQKKAILFYPDPFSFDYFISRDYSYNPDNLSPEQVSPFFDKDSTSDAPSTPDNSIKSKAILEENQDLQIPEIDENSVDGSFNEDDQELKKFDIEKSSFSQSEEEEVTVGDEQFNNQSVEDSEKFGDDIREIVPVQTNEIKKDVQTPTSSDLSFEPYHAVDYFASQGIKISQDELAKDTLGKQLKSFTDWLKTMKRLPSVTATDLSESPAEKKVETMAWHSLLETSVVTEAMAEVWAKQGAWEKAIETYNKLSLLNPSKKAFFATKIENLKRI